MTQPRPEPAAKPAADARPRSNHYRELLWHTLARQILLYFLPLLLLAAFFHFQYRRLIGESQRAHLMVLAEQQANTLDLFLRERLVNLGNLANDPQFARNATSPQHLAAALANLRRTSEAFVDLGVVDGEGNLVAYEGPVRFAGPISYASEAWFKRIAAESDVSIITDVYLGLRGQPHFTIAVKRQTAAGSLIVRSALSPDALHQYLKSLEGAREVNTLVVNADGAFQLVTGRIDAPSASAAVLPPREPRRGTLDPTGGGSMDSWAYAWLRETPWALVVHEIPGSGATRALLGRQSWILVFTVAFFFGMGVVIVIRARQIVGKQIAAERHEQELSGQLAHAAKLASVGELAAGIAHEVNNPLAIIAEEVGLLKDMMDPALGGRISPPDLQEHLDIIQDAVFRCRDITRKLLTFVRKTDIKIEPHRVEKILDDVINGMLGSELLLGNVEIIKHYDDDPRTVMTDRNQLVQVFLNLVKNAFDAMPQGGVLTVETRHRDKDMVVVVRDTGCGMTAEQVKRAFLPFFTTKPPGKGTGLGLSVSASILKNFGGNIYVESAPGQGTQFTIELPYAMPD
jgi:two-component system NtrC family sensor kinase